MRAKDPVENTVVFLSSAATSSHHSQEFFKEKTSHMAHWHILAYGDPVVHRQAMIGWVSVVQRGRAWSSVVDHVGEKNRIYIKAVAKNPL